MNRWENEWKGLQNHNAEGPVGICVFRKQQKVKVKLGNDQD